MKSLSLENRLPVNIVKEIFEYKAGKLYWKTRPISHFNSKRAANIFNSKYAGKEAGTPLCPRGTYLISQISYQGKKHSLLLHIATWVVCKGCYPTHEIDHKDGNGLNNQISNLSDSGVSLNMQNKSKYKNNSSGVCGIGWYTRYNKWIVYGSVNNKRMTLGYFDSLFDAACKRKAWEKLHGFTDRHGKNTIV